jgi:hypothetical protein
MREGGAMKKWSLLSIPLVALASIWVWSQAVVGAPDENYTGVVVREPDPRSSAVHGDGLTRHPGVAPLGKPSASAQPTSPNLKSAPLNPASSAPVPQPTRLAEPAQESSTATDPDSDMVQRVDPTQITSPAVAPTDDPTSDVPFDDSGTDGGNHDY